MSIESVRPGDLLAERFQLQHKLGSGGFGAVWSAIDRQDNSAVAVKILHTNLITSPWVLEQFQTEAEILTRFNHPRVARCTYAGTSRGLAFICMELVKGQALHDELETRSKDGEQFTIDEVSLFLDQISSTLDYAHSLGIVHRDLKPKNIIISGRGPRLETKLLDFGIAKVLYDTAKDATTVGRLLGSLLYLSPEQALSEGISHRADIFSLGTVLFELLTLRRAWAWTEEQEPLPIDSGAIRTSGMNNHLRILKRIVSAPRPNAGLYRSDLPVALSNVLLRAMASEPQSRFESAGEFAAAFRKAARVVSRSDATACDDELPEASLTHIVDPTRISDNSPVIPSDHDEKDLVATRVQAASEHLHNSPVNLGSVTPFDAPSPTVSPRSGPRQIPQVLVLLTGLLIGVTTTYIFSRPDNVNPVAVAIPAATTPPPSVNESLSAVHKPPTKKPTAKDPKPVIPTASKQDSKTENPTHIQPKKPRTARQAPKHFAARNVPADQRANSDTLAALEKELVAVQSAPDDFDRIERFAEHLRKAAKETLSGQSQTSLLRRLELAELQANIDELAACLKGLKQAAR